MDASTPNSPTCILAYVDEEGTYDQVARAALDLASRHHARLIYYDASSPSHFSEPIASGWSADGEGQQYGNPLTAGELETLGRAPIATLVRTAQAAGVEAFGWLPGEDTAGAMVEYASEQGADLILVPESVDRPEDSPVAVAIVTSAGDVKPQH